MALQLLLLVTASSVATQARGDVPSDVLAAAFAAGANKMGELLTDVGLQGLLAGTGPFSLLAPTDAAFDALEYSLLSRLKNETDTMARLLSRHVVLGRVSSTDLFQGQRLPTLSGRSVVVTRDDGSWWLDGEARVLQADLAADNGLIHSIDAVLLPAEDLFTWDEMEEFGSV